MRKDGGLTPAQLAWVLSEVQVPDAAGIPGSRTAQEVRAYLKDLIERLTRLARPT
jgi:aryl-alcohol dehydrogenase-like predicted oxidoreductase